MNGYKRLDKDYSIFIYKNGIIVVIYIDDILILIPTKSGTSLLKQQLDKYFKIKYLGKIS